MAEVVGEGGVDAVPREWEEAADATVTRRQIVDWAVLAHSRWMKGQFDGYTGALNSLWNTIDGFYHRHPESKL